MKNKVLILDANNRKGDCEVTVNGLQVEQPPIQVKQHRVSSSYFLCCFNKG